MSSQPVVSNPKYTKVGYYTITHSYLLNTLKSHELELSIGLASSEFILEKLLEKRDLHLNMLKHLEFELVMDPTEKEIKGIKKLQSDTINELKKIEQEIAFLTSEKPS